MQTDQYSKQFLKYIKYEKDPQGFMEDVLKLQLYDWQLDVCNHIKKCFEGDDLNALCLIAIAGGNNTGKTQLGKALSCWYFATQYESRNMLLTNSETQTKNTCYQDIKTMLAEIYEKEAIFAGDKKIHPKESGDSWYYTFFLRSGFESAITGRHYPKMFFFLDECLMFDDYIWNGLETMFLSGRVLVYASANPLSEGIGRGFHRVFTDSENRFGWYRRSVSLFDIPKDKYNPEFIETRKARYGENSAIYRASVLGLFSDTIEGGRLFTRDEIARAMNLEFSTEGEVVMGIDVSETHASGSASAYCIRSGCAYVDYGVDFGYYEDFEQLMIEKIKQYRPRRVVVDVNGHGSRLGDVLVNTFANDKDILILGIKGSYMSTQPMRFAGIRTELAYKMARDVRSGNFGLPNYQPLFSVLEIMTFTTSPQGKIHLTTKAELKKRHQREKDGSIDLFDAILYSYYTFETGAANGVNYTRRKKMD